MRRLRMVLVVVVIVLVAAGAAALVLLRDDDGDSEASGVNAALAGAAVAPPSSGGPATQPTSLRAAVAAGKLGPGVADELRRSGATDAFVWFVQPARTAPTPSTPGSLRSYWRTLESRESRVLRSVGGVQELTEYRTLPFAHVRIESEAALLELLARPDVARVNGVGRGSAHTRESLSLIRQPEVEAAGNTGAGTLVAVLDSGVEYGRTAFGSCTAPDTPSTCRVARLEEFGTEDGQLDDSRHGTNVAGIVAAVAPGTKIVAMDVFGWTNPTTGAVVRDEYIDSTVVRAIDAVRTLKQQGLNIRALNLSLGQYYTYRTKTDCANSQGGTEIANALGNAWADGIVPVLSSGNQALDRAETYRVGLGYPGCAPRALSVGAVTDAAMAAGVCRGDGPATTGADQVAFFSQTGSDLGVLAPGLCIRAADVENYGTSQAAPHVAGAVAVLAALRPAATPEQIVQALTSTGSEIVDSRMGFAITKRRLDLAAAADALVASVDGTTDEDDGDGDGDGTAPVVLAPLEQLAGLVSATTIDVKFTWSATGGGAVAEYSLEAKVGDGAWVAQDAVTGTQTSAQFALAFDTTYQFRVRAKDAAGTWGEYATGPTLTPGFYDDKELTLDTAWTRYDAADAIAGSAITSTEAGAWVSYTFTGRDIAVVARRFPTAGRATIGCPGSADGTLDLQHTTTDTLAAYWCRWNDAGEHSMRVTVEGTAGRPQVDVDGFVFLR